jgi:hypothetical protein
MVSSQFLRRYSCAGRGGNCGPLGASRELKLRGAEVDDVAEGGNRSDAVISCIGTDGQGQLRLAAGRSELATTGEPEERRGQPARPSSMSRLAVPYSSSSALACAGSGFSISAFTGRSSASVPALVIRMPRLGARAGW